MFRHILKFRILVLIVSLPHLSMSQPCQVPMPANAFKQKLNQLAIKPNDQEKLQFAKTMLPGSCLLSSQVKDMALVFSGDYYRYEFCKRAWKNTFDQSNFFDVYDTFGSISAAIRLYDFIHRQQESPHSTPTPVAWYPDLAYPVIYGYTGTTGCQLPIADVDFEILCKQVLLQQSDATRKTEAMRMYASGCLTMSQSMKIASVYDVESNRLSFLKEVYPKIYDLENYTFATEVFSHIPYKNDWLAYCAALLGIDSITPIPTTPACSISEQEYESILKSIENVSVNSTRTTLAKQILSTKKCFTVNQIAGIIKTFSVESSRLDLSLYAYDYCTDRENYYRLTEVLQTTSSKDQLLGFLNSKK